MCEGCGCMDPKELKTKPEECPPEKIRECHGEEEEHPCVGSEKQN